MLLYHSGVSDAETYSILAEAGVGRILVDIFDLQNVPPDFPHLALDCGEYRAHREAERIAAGPEPTRRNRFKITADQYERAIKESGRTFDLILNLDVWGNQDASFINFKTLRRRGVPVTPVWVYESGASRRILHYYLDRSPVVALGGLVPRLREEDETLLSELIELSAAFPGRFHVLGLRWLRAIDELKGLLFSADTSKFLAGARRGSIVFVHERSLKLQEAHARVFAGSKREDIRAWARLDRRGRCILSAKFLEAACAPEGGEVEREAA